MSALVQRSSARSWFVGWGLLQETPSMGPDATDLLWHPGLSVGYDECRP